MARPQLRDHTKELGYVAAMGVKQLVSPTTRVATTTRAAALGAWRVMGKQAFSGTAFEEEEEELGSVVEVVIQMEKRVVVGFATCLPPTCRMKSGRLATLKP
jgi:hypothetical protein